MRPGSAGVRAFVSARGARRADRRVKPVVLFVAVQRKHGGEHTEEFRALNLGGSREKGAISWLPVPCSTIACWKVIVMLSLIISIF